MIDYFHELSVLREGDGINFLKASATLDGCVKIYTSRIDSAATETGRLLSGLSSRNEADGDGEENSDDEEVPLEGPKQAKSKTSLSTLAKSFKQLRSKQIGSEIILDPYFKKTLTEFDEGGAKSLLMNMLGIDREGRVLFDTTESANFKTRALELRTVPKKLNISRFQDSLGPGSQFSSLEICPSIDVLTRIAANGEATDELLKLRSFQQLEDSELGPVLDNDNFAGEPIESFNGNSGGIFDISRLYAEDNTNDNAPNVTMVRLFNENFIEESVETSHLGELDLHFLEALDDISRKVWAGPEHWKISNLKKHLAETPDNAEIPATLTEHTERQLQTSKKPKETFTIDFFKDDVCEEELFKKGKKITLPKPLWSSETYNLLPEDQLFSTKNFIYLTLKPNKLINSSIFSTRKKKYRQRSFGEDENLPNVIDENFYAQNYENMGSSDNHRIGDPNEIHQSFDHSYLGPSFGGDNEEPEWDVANPQGFGSQMVQSLSNFKPNSINFARVAKRVDVNLLKDNLWNSYNSVKSWAVKSRDSEDKENLETNVEPPEYLNFTDVVHDVGTKYTKELKKDLSTSFCFICLLHLANEHGFTIESNEDYSDLKINN